MIYIISFICLLNVVLWAVFLIKFKKLFSTDSIIEKTRAQFNELVKDIDKSADRDIYLAEESIKRIKNAVADAEQKMNLFTEAADRLKDMISEADKINKLANQNSSLFQDFSKISASRKNVSKKDSNQGNTTVQNIDSDSKNSKKSSASLTNDLNKKANSYLKHSNIKVEQNISTVDPDAAFELTPNGLNANAKQGDLFDELENSSSVTNSMSEAIGDAVTINIRSQEIQITEDGAAFKEVPVINNKFLDDKTEVAKSDLDIAASVSPVELKRINLTKKVKQFYDEGYSVEEIASKLSCSITEVEFIIDII